MNVRSVLSATALAAGLCAVPTAAMAQAPAPSYLGPTGYILTPNADVTPAGCVNIGAHNFVLPTVSPSRVTSAHGNIGIGNRLELGYTRLTFHDQFTPNVNLANAKLAVLGPTSPVQLAGGVLDAFNDLFRTAYVVGQLNVGEKMNSKFIPRSLRAGAGWGTGSVLSPINGVFVNGAFNPMRAVELHGEWMNNTGMVNTGLRIRPSGRISGLILDVAALNVTGVGGVRGQGGGWELGGGLSYQMCFGKGRKHHDGDDEGGKDEKSAPAPAPPSKK